MSDLNEKKKGLWDNIRAKRARGERPAKKGEKDFPDPKSWKKAQAGSKKEGSMMLVDKKLQEAKIVESIANFLRDKANLGLVGKPESKERFSLSQRKMEDMYEEFALKFVDSPFYEAITRAFRKIHSYKFVSNPTFKLSLESELKSTAVPAEEIEKALKTIDELSAKESEKDVNWNAEQLNKISDMTRNADRRELKHEDPYNTPLSESVVNEGLSPESIEKLKKMIEQYGARQTGIKLIDRVLSGKIGLTSADLADSAIFADGLDSIEDMLKAKEYDDAVSIAKQTAEEMIEDEGGGFLDEGHLKK